MAEHTPGPWGWVYIKDDHGHLCRYPIALSGDGPLSDVLVASSNYEGEIFVRIEPANALLIAAAPDLLAACLEALRIARIPRPSAQAAALDHAENVFLAAITKATEGVS